MLTVDDINRAEFEKAVRGYRAQDVDEFLNKVADTIAQLNSDLSEALKQNEELLSDIEKQKEVSDKKLYTLAEKIEQYRADEDNLSAALLNAQRLSESMANKAKENAQAIITEAKVKAAQALQDLKEDYANEEKRLANLRTEVSKFKAEVLYLYKHHIEQLNALPAAEQEQMHIEKEDEQAQAVKKTGGKKKANAKSTQDENEDVNGDIRAKQEQSDDEAPDEIVENEQNATENPESFEDYLSAEFDD